MIDIHTLRELVAGGAIDTVIAALPDCYGRLMGKRLDAGFFLEDPEGGTHACDYLFTVDMEMEPVEGYAFTGWSAGYGDVRLVPDLSTLRVCSWLPATAIVLCDAHGHGDEQVSVAPRTILRRQVERAAAMGFTVQAASELEYYLFRTGYGDAAAAGYRDLRAAGWYIEDYHLLQGARTEDVNGAFRRHLAASGIPVESTKGEWGRGQHEINIRYAPVDVMADRHVLLKQLCKEVADSLGSSVTFMAKPGRDGAGSSCHIHLSLWRGDEPAFAGRPDTFRHFLAGWMAHATDVMAWYAPTVNSYKRYQAQSWAPTGLAWSDDNRTCGFRIVGEGPSTRIECRVPGADVNPYLAFAAALASGLDGLEQQLEPPPALEGDAYAASGADALPATLAAAADRFGESRFARQAFGDDVVDHYAHFARVEDAAHRRAVTDWELARYFERI